jgi:HGF/MSP/plasminogen-like protein
VVMLKTPVRFTDHIQPVCLPTKDTVYEAGRNCTISGWGATVSGSSSKFIGHEVDDMAPFNLILLQ